jgi:hypothetical protein
MLGGILGQTPVVSVRIHKKMSHVLQWKQNPEVYHNDIMDRFLLIAC